MNIRNTSWFLLCVSATVLCLPPASGDDRELERITRNLKELLHLAMEDFRVQMQVGSPEEGIPRLDPLNIDSMSFNIEENSVKAEVKLDEVELQSMSEFTVMDIRPNLRALTLEMTLAYLTDAVSVAGDYDLKGTVMKIIPVYGQGPFQIRVHGLRVRGAAKISVTHDRVTVDSASMDFDWKKLDFEMKGLFGGTLDKVLKDALPSLGESAFKSFRPFIMPRISQALTEFVNDQLERPHFKDLVKDMIAEIYGRHD